MFPGNAVPQTYGPNQGLALATAPETGQDQPARVLLRVLATSDLHGHILPWDDLCDRPAPDRGLAQVASLIASARAEVPGSLLLDNGDFLNGSPLADHVAETRRPTADQPHPMIAAMNMLGYDAATLGNHEFSHGLEVLRHALRQARFPIVTTNLHRIGAASGKTRAFQPRHVMLRRVLTDQSGAEHEVNIGILGFLPPQTALWERRHLAGKLDARGILAAARRAVPRLRRAGADLVIALSHSGLGGTAIGDDAENISCALAATDGVDAVIAGHTHQVFPPTGDGSTPALYDGPKPSVPHSKPMVMPGFFGSHLGVIDLTLIRKGAGWRVDSHRASVRPVARRMVATGEVVALTTPAVALTDLAAKDQMAMRAHASRTVGKTEVPLHSYFSLAGHSPVQTLLAAAQAMNMRNLLAGRPEESLPMLVAVAPFKAGGRGGPANYTDIPPGDLTARNVADLYIHPNSPVALRVTGADLANWLERSVSLFRQVAPGSQDACLIDPNFPAYNFDMIHGLTHEVDLSQPARHDSLGRVANPSATRITNLRYQGQPLNPAQAFVLVTNSYRASAGAGFAGTEPSNVVMEESRPLRLIVQDYIAAQGTVRPTGAQGWRFCPMLNTFVVFDSGPGAAAHALAQAEPVGLQPSGFLRFRLRL